MVPELSCRGGGALPELLVAIHTSRQSCSKAGKARIFALVWESSGESRVKSHRPREAGGERAVRLEVQRLRFDGLGDDFPDVGAKLLGFRLEGGGLREFKR